MRRGRPSVAPSNASTVVRRALHVQRKRLMNPIGSLPTLFSSNVADLLCAADFLRGHHQAPTLLIGQCLGGAAVLSAAQKIAEVRAVVTIGAPSELLHVARQFGEDALAKLDTEREVGISLAGRPFLIQRQFLDDLKAQHLHDHIATLGRALLVMHAPLDE